MLGRQLGVELHARVALVLGDQLLDLVAGHALGHVAEHLREAAVGVPGEALVVGGPRQRLHGVVVEPQVEDRVQHAGHGLPGAGANRHQQLAQRLAGLALQPLEGVGQVRHLAALQVGDAGLGGDREPGRDPLGTQHAGHLGDVGALASE